MTLGEFHARDGLYFRRLDNGDVVVEKRTADRFDQLQFRIELPASLWASIVSTMSAAGENWDTWNAALDRQRLK